MCRRDWHPACIQSSKKIRAQVTSLGSRICDLPLEVSDWLIDCYIDWLVDWLIDWGHIHHAGGKCPVLRNFHWWGQSQVLVTFPTISLYSSRGKGHVHTHKHTHMQTHTHTHQASNSCFLSLLPTSLTPRDLQIPCLLFQLHRSILGIGVWPVHPCSHLWPILVSHSPLTLHPGVPIVFSPVT